MAKRKDIPAISAASVQSSDTGLATVRIEPPPTDTPNEALASDAVSTVTPVETTGSEAALAPASITAEPKFSAPPIEISKETEIAKAEIPKAEVPRAAQPRHDEIRPSRTEHSAPAANIRSPAAAVGVAAAARTASAPPRSNRFVLLAASVAVAAGLGAVAGALGASGIGHAPSAAETTAATNAANDTAALQATIGKLRTELASVRTSVDAATKSAHGQFSKIAERFDRVERGQTERTGKLAKAIEGIERLEKRAEASPASDVTGSVTAPPSMAVAAANQPQPPIVPGWVLRDVYRGVAVLQGRRLGIVEVERGDVLPGVGRIEAIKKQDGHWVVVTSKGLITTSMR